MGGKMNGVKSKEFGAYWKSFFMTAMCYPNKVDVSNPEHVKKMKHYKTHFDNISYILPCKFCSEFTRDVLMKKYPLVYTGRRELMKSLYIWKDQVNKKLINQGCTFTQPSPPFHVILKFYNGLSARCDASAGKCV